MAFLNEHDYNLHLSVLADMANKFAENNELNYDLEDKQTVKISAAIYKILTDTIPIILSKNDTVQHLPYTYDFDDMFGDRDWTSMFVTKLLATKQGNCHSLPYLYKILADELGIKSHLALAPNLCLH